MTCSLFDQQLATTLYLQPPCSRCPVCFEHCASACYLTLLAVISLRLERMSGYRTCPALVASRATNRVNSEGRPNALEGVPLADQARMAGTSNSFRCPAHEVKLFSVLCRMQASRAVQQ